MFRKIRIARHRKLEVVYMYLIGRRVLMGTHGRRVPMGTQGYYPKNVRVWVGLGLCLTSMGIFGLGTQKGF